MTAVVFGSSNSNFTCFRNLRCLDQKKNVLIMQHVKNQQNSDVTHSKCNKGDTQKNTVKSKWINACKNVKIDQQERYKPKALVVERLKGSSKSSNLKQLLRGSSSGNISVREISNSSVPGQRKERGTRRSL